MAMTTSSIIIINLLLLLIISFFTKPITAEPSDFKQKPLLPPPKMEDAPNPGGGWKPVFDPVSFNTIIGYHWDGGFDYLHDDSTRLQTVELWIPVSRANLRYGKPTPSECCFGGSYDGAPYLIYIHGGAWRDPEIDAMSFNKTAVNILSSLAHQPGALSPEQQSKKKLAGIASINYRLSPYPNHPTDPSYSGDIDRSAKHPDHIHDVLTALGFLQKRFGVKEYILAGHSCGATLALQACMDDKRWNIWGGIKDGEGDVLTVTKPKAVVGFNGLYDLAGFIESPPREYKRWQEAYKEFVTGAFGEDEKVWREACPASADPKWVKEWKLSYEEKRRKVVLVQSLEDSLVPVEQTEGMVEYFEKENEKLGEDEKVKVVVLRDAKGGDHDEVWKRGDKMAEILWYVMEGAI
ncbi:Alpha/Beta hydrolase protein [Sordaria brevicollis]|uniref:Kynurenine formamidase n=1 Tax=Sordaria brevicollis TaxID=83679 RepID=A0AAE0PCK1_SORBR|nr:Alpha/Beta hydrolase protein [Sordaria brevicollis]